MESMIIAKTEHGTDYLRIMISFLIMFYLQTSGKLESCRNIN
nr:MAG TPA: hypothetical protein [Caudoviricetes sp.]DAX27243.1 MAG TPA: hypothetical protein [Caudoviricetes sp.]DAX94489.1 MAG TPA: hypothetical protein [Caudoviricetes sp.]